jgi:hypothetical protein
MIQLNLKENYVQEQEKGKGNFLMISENLFLDDLE